MTSKRSIENRLDRLDDKTDPSDETDMTISIHRVDQDGEDAGVVSELHCWTDDEGTWHSERSDYGTDGGEHP